MCVACAEPRLAPKEASRYASARHTQKKERRRGNNKIIITERFRSVSAISRLTVDEAFDRTDIPATQSLASDRTVDVS